MSFKNKKPTKVDALGMLWILSVLFEPLLLFSIGDRITFGVALNVARVFQAIVIIGLGFRLFMGKRIDISIIKNRAVLPYLFLVTYIFFISLTSFLLGGYGVSRSLVEQELLASIFHGDSTRPIVEFFILIYQFVYFIVFGSYFLKKKENIILFFKTAFYLLILHFVLGWIDFFLAYFGYDFLPRMFHDGRHVGLRFHGIAGEPRDAAIFMMTLFFLYATYGIFLKGEVLTLKKRYLVLILLSCFATASASFVVAICASAMLVAVVYLSRLSIRGFGFVIMGIAVGGLLIYLSLAYIERIEIYARLYGEYLLGLYEDPYQELPYEIKVSYNNVYPVIKMARDIGEGGILWVLFGHGIGSSGMANSVIYGEFNNPNNQAVRLLYEYGVVGTLFFLLVLYDIVRRCSIGLSRDSRDKLVFAAAIMIGALLAHRTNVWLVWVGVLIAVSVYRSRNPTARKLLS